MRLRENDLTTNIVSYNTVSVGPRSVYYPDTYSHLWPLTAGFNHKKGSYELMEDDDNADERSDKPCRHIKVDYLYTGESMAYSLVHNTSPTGIVIEGFREGIPYDTTLASRDSCSHLAGTTPLEKWMIPDYQGEAWYCMYPEIKAKLSALNSIYELKDFKHLGSLVTKTYATLGNLVKQGRSSRLSGALLQQVSPGGYIFGTIGRLKRRERKLPLHSLLRQASRTANDNFLNWEFAVSPLIDDICAVSNALTGVDKQLKRLLENQDVELKSHYKKYLAPTEVGVVPCDNDYYSGVGLNTASRSLRMLDGVIYSASVRYKYHFPPELLELAQTRALLDSLGIQMNPGNVWRAIPWSFVVDWFVKVGKSLDMLKVRNLEPIVEVLGASHSIKYSYQVEIWHRPDVYNVPEVTFTGLSPRQVVTHRVRVYVRKPFTPILLSIPKTSDYSGMEQLLSGSLLGSGWL